MILTWVTYAVPRLRNHKPSDLRYLSLGTNFAMATAAFNLCSKHILLNVRRTCLNSSGTAARWLGSTF
ncbi:uncharacterized protein LACBIDRAFT_298949 [Laccaria bicolor S238N-H82]|uniref:Predicted protein n=1 Tax=Laccaria bicolor (strain S238N-H82 / ATCC MYA-4686) TaxID=486041 RepID=B0DDN8_LACBS|nr:uncharacterized protein LACBIDRAFT_298949 [Laccaria bicolor S238N-H82]EDR07122.1 predicted protein [Laccaria bicolor S238N-H82]|eukprot:XP_001882053.1 predicted protein [Laccaria bicolor S238N-H82]